MNAPPPPPPLVSVVIPAYNAAWRLGRAVKSVLAQTYDPLEILVVDDGSTDDPANVLVPFGGRVTTITQKNMGLSAARNTGAAQATGEFIAFLDADDQWLPEKIQRQMDLLQARPEVGFCSTAARVEDAEGSFLEEWSCEVAEEPLVRKLFHYNTVAGSGSGVMVRRSLLEKTGGFDVELRSVEDVDMWMRLAAVSDYACIPEPLTVIERRGESMSRDFTVMREAHFRLLKKNRALLPPEERGAYWRGIYAQMLAEYAKLESRRGGKALALQLLLTGFLHAPLTQGRLLASLFLAILFKRKV